MVAERLQNLVLVCGFRVAITRAALVSAANELDIARLLLAIVVNAKHDGLEAVKDIRLRVVAVAQLNEAQFSHVALTLALDQDRAVRIGLLNHRAINSTI